MKVIILSILLCIFSVNVMAESNKENNTDNENKEIKIENEKIKGDSKEEPQEDNDTEVKMQKVSSYYIAIEGGNSVDNGDIPSGADVNINDSSSIGFLIGFGDKYQGKNFPKLNSSYEILYKVINDQRQSGTVKSSSSTISVDTLLNFTILNFRGRIIFYDYFSLFLGLAIIDGVSDGRSAYESSSTSITIEGEQDLGGLGYNLGFGFNFPIREKIEIYADYSIYKWSVLFYEGSLSQKDMTAGLRFRF